MDGLPSRYALFICLASPLLTDPHYRNNQAHMHPAPSADPLSINRACVVSRLPNLTFFFPLRMVWCTKALKPPPEVWKAIFELCLQDVRITLHPSNDCISFSQVCQYLRGVAFMTPRLWNMQRLPEFNFRKRQSILNFREFFTQIIRLSQSLPLTFSINIGDSISPANRRLAQYCLLLLCDQSHRWKAAYMDTSALSIVARHVLMGCLPLLEHIGVIGSSPGIGHSQAYISLLESAPKLTSIECHDFGSRSERVLDPSLLELPHVCHFSAGGSIESMSILSVDLRFLNFMHLTSLDIWFPALDSTDLWGLPPVTQPECLPLLTSLSLRFDMADWIMSIASRFFFPNVTSLTVATGYSCESDEFGPILALYTDRLTMLHHVGFSSNFLEHDTFPITIRSIPSLQSMSIFDICWNDSFFEWLETLIVPDPEEENIVGTSCAYPNIQRLSLYTHHRAGFIESHWNLLREQYPLQEPLVTDSRFSPKFTFKSGMKLLQRVVACRWIRPTCIEYRALISRLESLSVDHDCLYAMKEYAQESHSFLSSCWKDGMQGRPAPCVDWYTREIPSTWAGHDTVPRFFREEDEDEASPWAEEDSEQYQEDIPESEDSFGITPNEDDATLPSGEFSVLYHDDANGHVVDANLRVDVHGTHLEHDSREVQGRDGPVGYSFADMFQVNGFQEEFIVRVEGSHGNIPIWMALCAFCALLLITVLMLYLEKQ